MITLPLSQTGPADAFAAAVASYRSDMAAHRAGPPGTAAPVAPSPLVESVVTALHQGDPLPDEFIILEYQIVDDTPLTPEQDQAIQVLRETLK